jgi:hypothetical protein
MRKPMKFSTPGGEAMTKEEEREEKERWKEELRKEMREEELKAARKAGRKREREKHYARGRTRAFTDVANFLIRHGRPDIADDILKWFCVTVEKVRDCNMSDFDLGPAGKLLK